MSSEYRLSFTAEEIDKKLNTIQVTKKRVEVFTKTGALFQQTNLGLYAYGTDVNAAPFQYVEGDTYVVVWGDTEYECVSSTNTFQDQTYTGIGNLALMGMGDNTGEPFISIYVPYYDQLMIYSSDAVDTTRDVTIYHAEDVLIVGSGGSSDEWVSIGNVGDSLDSTGVTLSENPYEENNAYMYYTIKTNGQIAIIKLLWMMSTLQTINLGDAIRITIDDTSPAFDKLYNVINNPIHVFGQPTFMTVGGQLFGVNVYVNSSAINIRVISKETKTLTGNNYIGTLSAFFML